MGGVGGWLGKPHGDFIIDYLQYIFHFSGIFYLVTLSLIGLSFFYRDTENLQRRKFQIISLSWFLLPFLIGFIYSVFINSVLQYSVLIFSFPFLLMFMFSCFKNVHIPVKVLAVLAITVTGELTLIFARKHYTIFYHSFYKDSVFEAKKAADIEGRQNVAIAFRFDKKIYNFINSKIGLQNDGIIWIDSINDFKKFRKIINNLDVNYFAFSGEALTPLEYSMLIREKFPYAVKEVDNYRGDFCLFTKLKQEGKEMSYLFSASCDFDKAPGKDWSNINTSKLCDSVKYSGRYSYFVDTAELYTPGFSVYLDSFVNNYRNIIEISLKVYMPNTSAKPLLVSAIESNGKTIDWRAAEFNNYVEEPNKWTTVYLPVKLSDVYLRHSHKKLTIYVWNLHKNSFYMDDFEIKTRQGNQIIYGNEKNF
jgi:hypothetical protein